MSEDLEKVDQTQSIEQEKAQRELERAQREQFELYFADIYSKNKRIVKSSSKRETAKHFFILGLQAMANDIQRVKEAENDASKKI